MDVQKKIKDNVEDLQRVYRDLISWEKEMKRKENCLQLSKTSDDQKEIPPIRTKLRKEDKDFPREKMAASASTNTTTDNQKREESLFEKEQGNNLVEKQEWTQAIYHYTQAINCFPTDATFYCNRALCFLRIRQFKEAETDCTTALQIDSQYVKAYHRRALALKELNQLKEAHYDFTKALELDPNNIRVKNDMFKLEKLIADRDPVPLPKVTDTKFENSKESDKNLAYAKKEKGNLFVKKKEWAMAIECYTEACNLYPEDASFYLNRAFCFLKTNEPRKTVLDCIRVIELDPDNVKAYYRRALAHQATGNYSKAHDDFLMAFKLDPSDKTIQDNLTKLEKRLKMLPVENEKSLGNGKKELLVESVFSKSNNHEKRITGEKFIALGGHFVEPVKKPPHMLSKKPLNTVKIVEKADALLKSALEELDVSEKTDNRSKENEDPNIVSEKSNQKTIPVTNDIPQNNLLVDVDALPYPKTSMQFVSTWNTLSAPKLQHRFLKRIAGENFPSIFKEALESYIFSEILEILATEFVKAKEPVYGYLYGLSKVKRISALLLFATEEDNANVRLLFDHMKNLKEVQENELASLKSFYYC